MLTTKLAGSAALLTGGIVLALSIAACGPTAASSGAPGSVSTNTSANPTTTAPPTSSSGSPVNPTNPKTTPPPTVGSVPGSPGGGTLVPLPPYMTVPLGQISVIGMTTHQPTGVQTAEGGRILIFHEEQAGCEQVTAQAAAQNQAQVVVNVTVNSSAGAGRMCPMIVRVVQVTAPLNAPLGNRKVVFQGIIKH